MLGLVSCVWAAPVSAMSESGEPPSSMAGMLFQVILYLAVIIGLFLLAIKLLARRNTIQPGRTIKLWGGTALGQNKSVQIVEIGRSLYVLGVGGEIQLLDKINDPEEIEYIRSQSAEAPESFKGFGWLKKRPESEAQPAPQQEGKSFQQVFQQRMTHLTGRSKQVEQWISEEEYAKRAENDYEK
ncbi:flagellar biosynthetic protein FliO [Paenibacillus senegalensis]|uniref:flagellar biosynthetic protein FliO n=1 Tax=Paenibacillus senegalensis TaxID=1465766 RepID=UPI000287F77C|nr:flagellar biosynthetic protein FliO [Paenibacillus senegalensis]